MTMCKHPDKSHKLCVGGCVGSCKRVMEPIKDDCPKHDSGGGPCYCGKTPSPLRKITLMTEGGGRIVQIAVSLTEAIRMSGDPKVVSSKSEPWTPGVSYHQAAGRAERWAGIDRIYFTTGVVDPFPANQSERRYTVVDETLEPGSNPRPHNRQYQQAAEAAHLLHIENVELKAQLMSLREAAESAATHHELALNWINKDPNTSAPWASQSLIDLKELLK